MAKTAEVLVAKLVAREMRVEFIGRKFPLDDWGQVDDYVELKPNRYLFLEVESSQKHPCTNVLKVWPYLETHRHTTVVLAQAFFRDSPGWDSSRGKLACWLGQRVENTFPERFQYHRLLISSNSSRILQGCEELLHSLETVARWKSD